MLLHEGVSLFASRTPDAPALTVNGRRLSYAALALAAQRLAAHLVTAGVRPSDRVAILLPRSFHSVVAVLGTLQAGGVYVPLDESSPPLRQLRLLDDCRVRALITDERAWSRLVASDPGRHSKHDFVQVFAAQSDANALPIAWVSSERTSIVTHDATLPELLPEMPAYVLYTSGSTGQPKGVVVSHAGAAAFVDWAVRAFGIRAQDRLANVTELHFDLSVFDLFAAFTTGAEVHLVTKNHLLRPDRVVEWLHTEGITVWYSVPSTLGLLMDEGALTERAPTTLRHVMFAGEVFPVPRLRRLMKCWPGARFHNLFGPTETNVCTFYSLPDTLAQDATAIPIGMPCDHVELRLLDADGRPTPDGAEGEICVGGPAVMLEYFGQPAQSAAAFWPPQKVPGTGRLYRTGDRARRDASGRLWFVGRRDRQIKHRGYRIELGEVEAALAMLPGVREAAVTAAPDEHGDSVLRAVIVPESSGQPGLNVLAVKSHCGKLLPSYMVPRSVDFRASLPRMSTGKLDLRRL
jgi:amino acid adenylation domain-containing protein